MIIHSSSGAQFTDVCDSLKEYEEKKQNFDKM